MNPLRFVIDTNVLVSALRSQRGASFALVVHHLDDPRVELQVSNALMLEYEELLHRQRAVLGLTDLEIEAMLDGLLSVARRHEIFFTWRPSSADSDDDFVIDLAVTAGAGYVVTHNIRDLSVLSQHGIKTVTPDQFLKILKARPLP